MHLAATVPLRLSTITVGRSVSTTVAFQKQPAHDKQRYRRHFQEPRHSLPFVDEAPLKYLPQKPLCISGSWGSTDPAFKAKRFRHGEQLKCLPTTFSKLEELYHLEHNLWFHSLDLPLQCPEMLAFAQQLTRTNIRAWEPVQVECSLMHRYLTHAINERLTQLNQFPVNQINQSVDAIQARSKQRSAFITALMEAAYQAWIRAEPTSHLMHQPHQLDERGTVETFLKRATPKELFEKPSETVVEDVFEDTNDTLWDSTEGTVRYRIRAELAWQLRGSKPLKPFVSMDDPVCTLDEVPLCLYRPEAFDIHPVDCFRFSCIPRTQTLDFSEFARSVAGYWTHSPFWIGDPCEFGHVGALDVARSEAVYRDIGRVNQPPEVKEHLLMRHGLCEALLAAFAWTSAQAYNKGFTLYNEVTYPFVTQLLLIDRDHIQLMRYQLNSLTSLWKAADAGLPFNVAWYSPKLRLYELDSSTNGSVSVNSDAVSLITTALAHPTHMEQTAASLQPYLAATSDASTSRSDRSQTLLIPPSTSVCPSHTEPSVANSQTTGAAMMAQLEHAAWEATKGFEQAHPLRLFSPPRPHPNEVYLFKETNKSDLVNEFIEEMPSFGGPFTRLPEPYDSIARRWGISQRNRRPRSRVQAPPRRWR